MKIPKRELKIFILLLSLILFSFFFIIIEVNGYSTEQTLVLNKISLKTNLTLPEQAIFYDLLSQDTILNETNLVNKVNSSLNNDLTLFRLNFNSNISNLQNQINDLKINISNIQPKNDELKILQAKKDLILTIQKQKQEKEDPFNLFLEQYLNPQKQTTQNKTNSNIDLSNYYTKSEIDLQLKTINQDIETNKKELESRLNSINLNPIDPNLYVEKNNLYFGLFLIIILVGFMINKYLIPEFKRNKIILQRLQNLENLKKKDSEDIEL